MKKLICGLTAALAVTVAYTTAASADETSRVQQANLTRFTFDQSSTLPNYGINSGNLSLDFARRVVTVRLYRKVICPAGRFCSQLAYPPIIFQADLVSETVGACHEKIYTAVTDNTRVDGARTEIQVIDNTTSLCMTFVALSPTEVRIQTKTYRPEQTFNHVFYGDALKPIDLR